MQAAGVLWPGLQVAKTIKERKALHESLAGVPSCPTAGLAPAFSPESESCDWKLLREKLTLTRPDDHLLQVSSRTDLRISPLQWSKCETFCVRAPLLPEVKAAR